MMVALAALIEWLRPAPKRDPTVDRVLAVKRTTGMRRDREHERLSKSLTVHIERDLTRADHNRFAD